MMGWRGASLKATASVLARITGRPRVRANRLPTGVFSIRSILTGVYALFGPNPLPARLIQAVFAGVVQTILMWRLGKRLFNPTAGLLAAAFGAVYIYFVYYAGALITETFYITALLWIMDIALRIDDRAQVGRTSRNDRGWRHWLIWGELGLAIGVGCVAAPVGAAARAVPVSLAVVADCAPTAEDEAAGGRARALVWMAYPVGLCRHACDRGA